MSDELPRLAAAEPATGSSEDSAATDALFSTLYNELHRLAQAHLRRGGAGLTISATTLLHEAYVDLAGRDAVSFPDRNRFLGYASRAMRGLIVDYVRRRGARKRGGELIFQPITSVEPSAPDEGAALQQLADALEELESVDPALAQVVDLKFFCGFSLDEIAGMRGVSERTVRRDWGKARTLLYQSMADTPDQI